MLKKKIAILGASPNKEKYSNKAIHMAQTQGLDPVLVNPKYTEIDGLPVIPSLKEVGKIDYLSIYLSYSILESIIEDIIHLANTQNSLNIILNPGSDTPMALILFNRHQLPFIQACTLVLLSTNQI